MNVNLETLATMMVFARINQATFLATALVLVFKAKFVKLTSMSVLLKIHAKIMGFA